MCTYVHTYTHTYIHTFSNPEGIRKNNSKKKPLQTQRALAKSYRVPRWLTAVLASSCVLAHLCLKYCLRRQKIIGRFLPKKQKAKNKIGDKKQIRGQKTTNNFEDKEDHMMIILNICKYVSYIHGYRRWCSSASVSVLLKYRCSTYWLSIYV